MSLFDNVEREMKEVRLRLRSQHNGLMIHKETLTRNKAEIQQLQEGVTTIMRRLDKQSQELREMRAVIMHDVPEEKVFPKVAKNYYCDREAEKAQRLGIKDIPRNGAYWTPFEHELCYEHMMKLVKELAMKVGRKESAILWEFKKLIKAELGE